MIIALVHQGALVAIENQFGELELPATFVSTQEAFDLPLMIEVKRLFGWRAEPGGALGKRVLPSGTELLVVSAFFDGDTPPTGAVPTTALRHLYRHEIRHQLSDPWLAELGELACS